MVTLIKVHTNGKEEIKDVGANVQAIKYNDDGTYEGIIGNEPVIGCSLLVGSITT